MWKAVSGNSSSIEIILRCFPCTCNCRIGCFLQYTQNGIFIFLEINIALKPYPTHQIERGLSKGKGGSIFILPIVLVRVTISVIKYHGQSNLEKEGFISLIVVMVVHHQKQQGQKFIKGRNLETETNAEVMEGCCLLTCSS